MKRGRIDYECFSDILKPNYSAELNGSYFGSLNDLMRDCLGDVSSLSFEKSRSLKMMSESLCLQLPLQKLNCLDLLNNIDAKHYLTRPISKRGEELVSNLWDPMNKESIAVLSSQPHGIKGSDICILGNHYYHMGPDRKLFDESINAFMRLLQTSVEKQDPSDQSIFETSLFYEQMARETPENFSFTRQKKWLSKFNLAHGLFKLKRLYIPIYVREGKHWILCVVNFWRKRIECYDSLASISKRNSYLKVVLKYIQYECRSQEFEADEWRIETVAVPQQINGFDCGVFVCMYAYCIFNGFKLNFTHLDITLFRKRITLSIFDNKLDIPR